MQAILEIMERYHRKGMTITGVGRNTATASAHSDRVVVMRKDRIQRELRPKTDTTEWKNPATRFAPNHLLMEGKRA